MILANITILFSVCRTKKQKGSRTRVSATLSSMKINKSTRKSRSKTSWKGKKIIIERNLKGWNEKDPR
jgi:hypothetical protein